MNNIRERFAIVEKYGIEKAQAHWLKTLILGILGGAMVAIGYLGAIAVKGNDPNNAILAFLAAGIFPVGIMMVVFLGGSLFTSDALVGLALFDKKVGWLVAFKNWGIVLFGNLVGALLIALSAKLANFFIHGRLDVLGHYIEGKQGIAWYSSISSGILCNLLVAGAVWMAKASSTAIGKVFLLWFPITLFVAAGFQHIVANFFIYWSGILYSDQLESIKIHFEAGVFIYNNLLGTTLGNFIGGAIIIPAAYIFIERLSIKKVVK
ncbi:MAG: formate/nitrite transporter family protein [Mycoplasmataceae bacterium]|nr:formate/nitrite transporter family protein [Mycoplasmataceae bacterium]